MNLLANSTPELLSAGAIPFGDKVVIEPNSPAWELLPDNLKRPPMRIGDTLTGRNNERLVIVRITPTGVVCSDRGLYRVHVPFMAIC